MFAAFQHSLEDSPGSRVQIPLTAPRSVTKMPKCTHDWIETGLDINRYLFERINFVRCLQCKQVLKVKYEDDAERYGLGFAFKKDEVNR